MARKSESPGGKRGLFSTRRRAGGSGVGSGSDSDYRKQIRARKGAGKNGCSSKLFMLVLPLIAVSAYLLLT